MTPAAARIRAWLAPLHRGGPPGLWQDPAPIRAELFGPERMEHHARTLAVAQQETQEPAARVLPLSRRMRDNARVLIGAERISAQALSEGRQVPPAADWLMDNFHIVEAQLRQIKDDLPAGYYRQLPKLTSGPLAGYPRVIGIGWAYVAHTDSLISAPVLMRFVHAYQQVQPLTIGELWAIAISLRILLIDNMRRLSVQITEGLALRAEADLLVDRVMGSETEAPVPLHIALAPWDSAPLPQITAAQIAKRLRGLDPRDTPLLGWLEGRLERQGLTLDEVVAVALARQGASNVTMRNIVTSMRLLSEIDWADFVEAVSLIDQRLTEASDFAAMDFATRNAYRTAIEQLARGSDRSEPEVTEAALAQAAAAPDFPERDPGHALIGVGRQELEHSVGFKPPLRLRLQRRVRQGGLAGYLGAIGFIALLLSLLAVLPLGGPLWLALLTLPLALEAATALVNLAVTRLIGPELLPGMDLSKGVPDHLRTLVAVPVLLTSDAEVQEMIERLEVHHLSSTGGALHFALLSDGPDAALEVAPQDGVLIAAAQAGIARLNASYPAVEGDRFLLLHRHRRWNPAEGVWMGWERKRGKLEELNRLLRGAADTSFMDLGGRIPPDIVHVITLDADTRLLRDTASRMIGKLAHPLNRPHLDPALQRVTRGYGILQPRVTPGLPIGAHGSLFARIFSSPGGIEPYAAAVSDVYQDLFGEGSFTGKGIYHVDAFAAAQAGRVPENTMLSHDLFEGIFARAGLASDIEVVEDFPARYDVDARRQHRWARGDWQLLPWIFGPDGKDIPALGRAKMLDNLRRSVSAPLMFIALAALWLLPPGQALAGTLALLALYALPFLLPLPFAMIPSRRGLPSRAHFAALVADTATALARIFLGLALLAQTAWQMADAVLRTLIRLVVTRRHLLEWVTAARSAGSGAPGLATSSRRMAGGLALALIAGGGAVLLNPASWPIALPLMALWLAAPLLAHRISQPTTPHAAAPLTAAEARSLRLIARRTWRYFETFVTADENHLPPDNFQEVPEPVVAHRTSPTNIGLYLLSVTVARDMGWCAEARALERLEQTLTTMEAMARFRGHFYNWYDTQTLMVLSPAYVSSVDSGNLAGHLIALAQTCRAWQDEAAPDPRQGLADTLALALQAITDEGQRQHFDSILTDIDSTLPNPEELQSPADADEDQSTWLKAAREILTAAEPTDRSARLEAIAGRAHALAMAMEFGFLMDPEKMLLTIGFSVATNTLDPSCYDLLASEARQASLFAIAKGDVETRHWFRLGRAATPVGTGGALLSWSGSMFEYLMPLIVMHAPAGSVLEQTDRLIVARQRSYATALGLPWGISESSYNARDLEMTYQYSNFGVPGLGLKRGLADNRVIAPYATGLAAMVDPQAAVLNFAALSALGAEGQYGFYEAVDFTADRLPAGAPHALVRSFMAHHQGMTITAIANVLQDGRLRDRFHAEPLVQAVDLLLQERVPRDAASTPPRIQDPRAAPTDAPTVPALRRFDTPATTAPTAHLLSNGHFSTLLTPTGAGSSRWRGLAITRWRAEPGREDLGSFIYLRDVLSGSEWSAGVQPLGVEGDRHSAQFCEHHAAFLHQGRRLTTRTEVVVSSEDDAEARRVTLTNTGRHPREVELTSYMELVLAPASSDLAHPAFSKMFVVTDFMPELGVIVATRRRRSDSDPEVWAAHIAVVEGEETAPLSFETSREKFIGRGGSVTKAAMADAPLSGSMGTVLDPIFSLRRRLRIPPGGRARVTFWTLVAESPTDLLDLVDRHRDPSAFDRAVTLAWTLGQVQLRHLGLTHATAREFQRLAGVILRGDGRLRSSPARVAAGAGPQSLLWPFGISGDLPILLVRIDDLSDIHQVHEALTAVEYWQIKQMTVDLVILNERSSSYVQDLHNAIEAAVRSSQARPATLRPASGPAKGAIHVLRSDLISPEALALLTSVAAVVLVAGHGGIGAHLDRATGKRPVPLPPAPLSLPAPLPESLAPLPDREFFNGLGGFAEGGREYVVVLERGQTTPAPWSNVIANPGFGFQVSADGAGSVWAENSRENLLTPWSNDPVCDPAGEAIFLRDLDSGAVWTPTALPIRGPGRYVARHGFGYSRFQHGEGGIEADLVQFVPLEDPVKISHLRLHNTSGQTRRLSVTAYAEWVLGTTRTATAAHLVTEIDAETGAVLARNPFGMAFPGRVAFADLGDKTRSGSANRSGFLGAGGIADPDGLRAEALDGAAGAALDPCAALQRLVTIPPGGTVNVVFLIGQSRSLDEARALIHRIRASDPTALLERVRQNWTGLLTAVQVKTPDRAMDVMLNGWLLYQTLSARIWARAGFYQASGAYGFRDQLQDGMALTATRPEMTRAHLLRAAARQFPEGDVQHWWLPHSGQGVRTRISDDRVWLGFGVAQYVEVSGDTSILDEVVPFLEGPTVPEGAHDAFYQPQISDASASLFEHVARGLDQAIALTGANGMPLMGTGDWNDGMNRVGEHGHGTSVWLGWLLIATLRAMAPLADSRDPARATRWRTHAEAVRQAIEARGWDGDWYRRATYDDGTILGTAQAEECRIDSIAQSWAVLSGAGDPERAEKAMASLTRHLIHPETGLALLFTPPFDQSPQDPGYIKAYPPGLRENGGQYSHAAMWAILAQARRGDGDAAAALFALVNPINHSRTPAATARYRVEPYVIAADVYSTAPHVGRGGWTWYTGSAGWMYRAGVEGILGLTRRGQMLSLDPSLPRDWPRAELEVTFGADRLHITIDNPHRSGRGIAAVRVDGEAVAVAGEKLLLALTGGDRRVEVTLGPVALGPVALEPVAMEPVAMEPVALEQMKF